MSITPKPFYVPRNGDLTRRFVFFVPSWEEWRRGNRGCVEGKDAPMTAAYLASRNLSIVEVGPDWITACNEQRDGFEGVQAWAAQAHTDAGGVYRLILTGEPGEKFRLDPIDAPTVADIRALSRLSPVHALRAAMLTNSEAGDVFGQLLKELTPELVATDERMKEMAELMMLAKRGRARFEEGAN